MAKETVVTRPTKKSEYVLKYATKQSEKGWRDLVATIRNPMSETWDFLTRTPLTTTPTNYPLEGPLGVITRSGRTFQRWQHKPTLKALRGSGSTSTTTPSTWNRSTPRTQTRPNSFQAPPRREDACGGAVSRLTSSRTLIQEPEART